MYLSMLSHIYRLETYDFGRSLYAFRENIKLTLNRCYDDEWLICFTMNEFYHF